MLNFRKISIDDKVIYDKYRSKCEINASEGAFATVFIWDEFYNATVADDDEFFYIRFNKKNTAPEFLFPVGIGDVKSALRKIEAVCEERGESLKFALLTKEQADIVTDFFGDAAQVVSDRDCADYVYLTEKMINLSGKKLHSKKNHLNYFLQNYNFEFVEVSGGELLDKCAEKAYQLVNSKEKNRNSYEIGAMHSYFENFDALDQKGCAIIIDGAVAAMSFGERLCDDCALIQIELADDAFRGAYQAINKLFLENYWSEFKYVNREEDMGIDGLRKAKMSYRPEFLVEKYFIAIND